MTGTYSPPPPPRTPNYPKALMLCGGALRVRRRFPRGVYCRKRWLALPLEPIPRRVTLRRQRLSTSDPWLVVPALDANSSLLLVAAG